MLGSRVSERERPQRAGGGRGGDSAAFGGSGSGGQRLRDGSRGVAAGRARRGGVGGDRGGRSATPARLSAGAAAEAGEGASGGVDQGDAKMELPENRARYRLRKHTVDRDREAGDGLSAVTAARHREGGGRVEAGDAGLQLPTPAQADVGLTGSWGANSACRRPLQGVGKGLWTPSAPDGGMRPPVSAATTHLNSHSGHRSNGRQAPSRARLPRPKSDRLLAPQEPLPSDNASCPSPSRPIT